MADIEARAWTGLAGTTTESPPSSGELSVIADDDSSGTKAALEEARVVDIVLYEHEYGRLDLSEEGSKAQVSTIQAHNTHMEEFEQ